MYNYLPTSGLKNLKNKPQKFKKLFLESRHILDKINFIPRG
jgi:hypothetical protein